jgi:hypothetical protein
MPGELIQPKLHTERSATNSQHFAATPSMASHNNKTFLESFEAA